MKRALLSVLLLGATAVAQAQSAPHFYRATSIKGAIAYQSAGDTQQFFYLPTQTDSLLGERLKNFRVSYYGVGKPFYIQNSVTGKITNSVGAIVSATAVIGLSDDVRKKLIAQIEKDFQVKEPKLTPLPLANAKIRSLLLGEALTVGKLGEIYSTNPAFEQEFAFTAGARDNLFAQLLATSDSSGYAGVKPNPHFAVELVGETEFVGDPWKVSVSCDLGQVWKQVRTSVSVSASVGWFRLGEAAYNSINQALERDGACKYTEIPGSTFDRDKNLLPILEMTRRMFEQLNQEARAGQGFFKFEPNPEAPPVSAGKSHSVWPWSVSVNMGYSSAHFKQSLKWTTTVELATRFNYPISATTTIAVACDQFTKMYFQDLGNTAENCITQQKIDTLMTRLAAEKSLVNRKLAELDRQLTAGTITVDVYNLLYQRWTTESQSEGNFIPVSRTARLMSARPNNFKDEVFHGLVHEEPGSVAEDIAWAKAEVAKSRPH